MYRNLTARELSEPAIKAEGLVKIFGDKRVVDEIYLSVPAGKVYGILGPNGAGKTTTINILTTLLKPDGGRARIFGHDVLKEADTIRQLIGLTGQYASLDENLTAFENLYIFARLLGFIHGNASQKADALLSDFGLEDAATKIVSKFSGGMRRRLDLAASLISEPPLLFLDEPTTGLDPYTRSQMWNVIRRLVDQGTTVLLTTQYLDEADQLADRIAVIDHGKVVAEGTPDELKKSVGSTSLHLQLTRQTDAEKAMGMIKRTLGTEGALTDKVKATISVPMKDPDGVFDLLLVFRDGGISLAEFSVQKPTLDEVFLTITGHITQEQQMGETHEY